ncbi:MAG: hypothetical protein M3393_01360 [Actinomycetota bacterium]|nr:hypothetical protein [Actinomycetota bacterium]
MEAGYALSAESRALAGILLIALVTVETGGLYLLWVVRGRDKVTPFQLAFARAGHAHAGVLLILALLCQVFADATGQSGFFDWLSRSGVAVSALLMPAGFFFSSMGEGREKPNRLVVLVLAGAALLAVSLLSLALGLLG